ncbi:TPA: type II restriction endonuclease subunit M [Pseudomonas aeruginosa]|nr:type II restriction endonuclease subunit M [Pseudomonas aeruginosa]
MTIFLRLLAESEKATALAECCAWVRQGEDENRCFEVAPDEFDSVPGKPFAYWVSSPVRETFRRLPPFEGNGRTVRVGLQTSDDFRFVRNWWEIGGEQARESWLPFAKGGSHSPFYTDVHLVVNWKGNGGELESFSSSVIRNAEYYFRPGITWPLRARSFAPQAMPAGSIFSVRGYSAFPEEGEEIKTLAIFNSTPFDYLYKTALGRFGYPEFIVGILQIMPWVGASAETKVVLGDLARSAWSLKRSLDTVSETSHAFLLPTALRPRQGLYDRSAIEAALERIQAEIDDIAFDLYGFSDDDRAAALGVVCAEAATDESNDEGEEDEDETEDDAPSSDSLLSWAVGVAFGRFDWRLATSERSAPSEPEPFDPLPAKSPGMLPVVAAPFHQHTGILVDDQGNPHDLGRLVEQVLEAVDATVVGDVRRWLQKDFFAFHLKRYSKSRRKAPIYWPLATASGSYTLWLYYPSLSDQTLFTAVNDFVDPKLKDVRKELQDLRDKGAGRSQQDEKRLEALVSLEHELADLRDSLLEIAPNYRPNHDDGVQITAAPLWKLFRHKPWQKVLKDTWAKLEKGDYDWAHLAMNYWPDRVRDKCVTDKSLAIAHGLEHLYVEPEPVEKKTRGRKKAGSTE